MNNKCLIGSGATTAVSQLQWFQNLKDNMYETVKLHIKINKNNGEGQTHYVKCYRMDRWFSIIRGSLGRSYVLRNIHVVLAHDGFVLCVTVC